MFTHCIAASSITKAAFDTNTKSGFFSFYGAPDSSGRMFSLSGRN